VENVFNSSACLRREKKIFDPGSAEKGPGRNDRPPEPHSKILFNWGTSTNREGGGAGPAIGQADRARKLGGAWPRKVGKTEKVAC